MKRRYIVAFVIAVGCGKGAKGPSAKIPAYLSAGSCATYSAKDACVAERECTWVSLGRPCPAGGSCPAGVCIPSDPCFAINDSEQCTADSRCSWSRVSQLCPVGMATGCADGGFCHAKDTTGGCACVSPLSCPDV